MLNLNSVFKEYRQYWRQLSQSYLSKNNKISKNSCKRESTDDIVRITYYVFPSIGIFTYYYIPKQSNITSSTLVRPQNW